MDCDHCDKKAEWKWTDADGNEAHNICERCMTTLPAYMASPGWHFELIPTLD